MAAETWSEVLEISDNHSGILKSTPPIPKEETFKGYWNPAHNKVIGMPFRGPVQGNHILSNFIKYKMKHGQQALPLVSEGDTPMCMNEDDTDNTTEAASLPLYCEAFKLIIMTNTAGARQSKRLRLDLEEFIFPDDDTFDMLFATACRTHRYPPPKQDVKTIVKDLRAYFNFPVGKVITYELNVACPHSYDAMRSKLHSERRFTDFKDDAVIGAVDMRDAYMTMSDNAKYFSTNIAKVLKSL
ncbi:uncharacterized protein TrAtP1_001503 [Trichoderma atroviride]|uniref:uncharacterized protein n=1 Tax=Hypocrea atroviridis TaxID=63577 RepID=UPI00332FB301|nr:hypothetical protein TrAtP1_001503 [Trichoderma atroviride]